METITIGKQYEKNSELVFHKKKILFYNESQDILVYSKEYGIYIPSVSMSEETVFEEEIRQKTSIDFANESIEPLVQIINYNFKLKSVNNKLVKQNLKFIRDYYICLVQFDNALKQTLQPIVVSDEERLPKILNIEELMKYLTDLYREPHQRDEIIALEVLNSKMKGKVYEKSNSNI